MDWAEVGQEREREVERGSEPGQIHFAQVLSMPRRVCWVEKEAGRTVENYCKRGILCIWSSGPKMLPPLSFPVPGSVHTERISMSHGGYLATAAGEGEDRELAGSLKWAGGQSRSETQYLTELGLGSRHSRRSITLTHERGHQVSGATTKTSQ